MRRLISFLLAAYFSAVAAAPPERTSLVGVIKQQDAIDGCSWSAESPAIGKGFFFLAEYDQSDVVMNILGTDVHLKRNVVSSRGALKQLGETLQEVYEAPSLRVEATYTAIWLCGPNDAACEVTKFKAVFKVRAGDKEQRVVGNGNVGC